MINSLSTLTTVFRVFIAFSLSLFTHFAVLIFPHLTYRMFSYTKVVLLWIENRKEPLLRLSPASFSNSTSPRCSPPANITRSVSFSCDRADKCTALACICDKSCLPSPVFRGSSSCTLFASLRENRASSIRKLANRYTARQVCPSSPAHRTRSIALDDSSVSPRSKTLDNLPRTLDCRRRTSRAPFRRFPRTVDDPRCTFAILASSGCPSRSWIARSSIATSFLRRRSVA